MLCCSYLQCSIKRIQAALEKSYWIELIALIMINIAYIKTCNNCIWQRPRRKTWKNYVHVRKRAHKVLKRVRNVHVKIYGAHKTYVDVTYRTNKWFLNFVWLIYLHFWNLAQLTLLFKVYFIQNFFSSTKTQTYCPLRFAWFVQFSKLCKLRIVTIFSLNYHEIVIICVLLLCIKVIRNC